MKPVVLCIMDGVGMKDTIHGNAVKQANTPHFDFLWNRFPHSLLEASGEFVGLPQGQMGNSEVGHMNLGAGRVVYQPLQLINEKIRSREIYNNARLLEVVEHVRKRCSRLHLCGLLSDGGIHSHIDHLFGMLELCKKKHIDEVYIHVFTDGRDTLPRVASQFISQLEAKMRELGVGKIASISGRYYAMDRDHRFERVFKAYNVIVNGDGESYETASQAILANYDRGIDDEFIVPAVIDSMGTIQDGDGIMVFNYRPDRLKELFGAITNPDYVCFDRIMLKDIKLVTMMPVGSEIVGNHAYELEKLDHTLGSYFSDHGLKQLRIAETEKYAHVTYFFDGGIEKTLTGCERILIPSPSVATYDMQPEMSANEITDELVRRMDEFDVIILNYANGDMVGHTGKMEAAIQAMEVVDDCLGRVYQKVDELGGTLIIVADHGNCDTMLDENDQVITSHSTALVPFIITQDGFILKNGKLGDVAPTMLSLMGLIKPMDMTGDSLIVWE